MVAFIKMGGKSWYEIMFLFTNVQPNNDANMKEMSVNIQIIVPAIVDHHYM